MPEAILTDRLTPVRVRITENVLQNPLPDALKEIWEPVAIHLGHQKPEGGQTRVEPDPSTRNILFVPKGKAGKTEAFDALVTRINIPKGAQILLWDETKTRFYNPGYVKTTEALSLPILVPIEDQNGKAMDLSHTSCVNDGSTKMLSEGAPQGCIYVGPKYTRQSAFYHEDGFDIVKVVEQVRGNPVRYLYEVVKVKYLIPSIAPNGSICHVCFTLVNDANNFMHEAAKVPLKSPWMEVGAVVWNETVQSLMVYYNPTPFQDTITNPAQ
jgi:hypothetical protein